MWRWVAKWSAEAAAAISWFKLLCDICHLDACWVEVCVGVVCVLDFGVVAEFSWDAGELVAADDDHRQCGDVGETVREVSEVVLVDEQGDELLQPAETNMSIQTSGRCPTATPRNTQEELLSQLKPR